MIRFRPGDYAEAAALRAERPSKPRQPMSKGRGFQSRARAVGPKQAKLGHVKARIRTRPDPELAAWGRQVKERDGNRCQWPSCEFCRGSQDVTLDPHHRALRSARPDLRLVLTNGVTVCRRRHNFIHSPEGHNKAVRLGFLSLRSRELAAKEGTLGIR